MKKLLIILLLLPVIGFCQKTKIKKDQTYSLNWTEKNNSPQTLLNSDIHYTLTEGSTATYVFNTTKAKIYFEGCDNHSVARINIRNAGNTVIATHDFDTYVNTGGTTGCGTPEQIEYEFTGLAAGQKTAEIIFLSDDLGQTPQRTSIAVDGGKFYD